MTLQQFKLHTLKQKYVTVYLVITFGNLFLAFTIWQVKGKNGSPFQRVLMIFLFIFLAACLLSNIPTLNGK